ncbi:MAG: B3/B4 domain-containing protein [Thermoanaerobaculia bacterium]
MRLTLTPSFLELFPDAVLGVAVARGVDNAGEDAALTARLREAEALIGQRLRDQALAEHPRVAVWREAYRKFGAKPKDYPSSVENLLRRALKGEVLLHINKIVDIYNAVSLETLLPAGAEDLDAIEGDVALAVAGEGEAPVKLLGEPEARPPRRGEVIYRDRAGAICRRWNWKEADRTRITAATRNALLVVEGLPPIERSAVSSAIEEIARAIPKHCGGAVVTALLDRERPVLELAID